MVNCLFNRKVFKILNQFFSTASAMKIPLVEPKFILSFRLWSILVGIFFITTDSLLIWTTVTNYFGHEQNFVRDVDWVVVAVTRIPTVLVGLMLIYGATLKKSTPIAVFFYTVLEAHLVFFIIYLYYYTTFKRHPVERWIWPTLFSKYCATTIGYHQRAKNWALEKKI